MLVYSLLLPHCLGVSGKAILQVKTLSLDVGQRISLAKWPSAQSPIISASSVKSSVADVWVSPSLEVYALGRNAGKTVATITASVISPKGGRETVKQEVNLVVTNTLPKIYYQALDYLNSTRTTIEAERNVWSTKVVGLPSYYTGDEVSQRMTQKDVDATFSATTRSGLVLFAKVLAENEKLLKQAAVDLRARKIDNIQFINTLVGFFGYGLQTQADIYQKVPFLNAVSQQKELAHRHELRWKTAEMLRQAWRAQGLKEPILEAKFKQIELDTVSDAKKDFDQTCRSVREMAQWAIPKRQIIGEKLLALQEELLKLSRAKNDIYAQNANFVNERFRIVWYGASFYGPETYAGKSGREAFALFTPFWHYDFCKKPSFPDLQTRPAEPAVLCFSYPLPPPKPLADRESSVYSGAPKGTRP